MSMNSNTGRKGKTHVPTEKIVSVAKLVVEPTLNVRMRKGSTVFGIMVNKDGYDLASMMAQILERGKILEAIHVSERKTGELVVLRGNRRTLAGQQLLEMPDTPEEVKKELNATRVLVFTNLTPEDEREKVMDQNSKPFGRSEIIRYAWSLRANGQSFERIAVDNFEMWGQFGRNARTTAKLAEIRAISETDIAARRKAIKTWLRGTVDEYVIPAYDLGPTVQKATLLSEMALDGLLTEQDEKPMFYTTRDPQARMKKLGQAKEKDGSKWSPHLGGEEFNKQLLEFHNADFPAPGSTPQTETTAKKRLSMAELKIRMNACKSSPARMAYSIAQGETENSFQERDDAVSLLEAKETLFLQFAENLKDDATVSLKDILTQIFLRDNILDFRNMLESNSNAVVKTESQPEAKGDDTDTDDEENADSDVPTETVAPDGTFPLA